MESPEENVDAAEDAGITESLAENVTETLDFSDEAIIRLMMSQGKSKNQAKSALAVLKLLQISPPERHRILSEPDHVVHFVCCFGSLIPLFIVLIAILLLIIVEIYDVFFD